MHWWLCTGRWSDPAENDFTSSEYLRDTYGRNVTLQNVPSEACSASSHVLCYGLHPNMLLTIVETSLQRVKAECNIRSQEFSPELHSVYH